MSVEAIAAIIAAVAAGVAIVAAFLSHQQSAAAKAQVTLGHRQLELAEKIRKEQSEPYVIVDIQPSTFDPEVLILVIENIGTTVARNVRFSFDPPLHTARQFKAGRIRDATILKDGISMLPPGRRIELLFDLKSDHKNQMFDLTYSVTVYADGPHDQVEPMRYVIDLAILYGWHVLQPKTVHDGVEAVEEMRKDIRRIGADLRALIQRMERSGNSENPQE